MAAERESIIEAYAAQGVEACSGKGGLFLNGRGWVSLAQARSETGINQAQKRQPRTEISAYGDWAWVAALNRA